MLLQVALQPSPSPRPAQEATMKVHCQACIEVTYEVLLNSIHVPLKYTLVLKQQLLGIKTDRHDC